MAENPIELGVSGTRERVLEKQHWCTGVVRTSNSVVVAVAGMHSLSSAVEELTRSLTVADLLMPPQTAVATLLRSWVAHSAGIAFGVEVPTLSSIVEQLVHSIVAVELRVLPQTAAGDVRQSATCAHTSQHVRAPWQMPDSAEADSAAASALLHHVRSSAESS